MLAGVVRVTGVEVMLIVRVYYEKTKVFWPSRRGVVSRLFLQGWAGHLVISKFLVAYD